MSNNTNVPPQHGPSRGAQDPSQTSQPPYAPGPQSFPPQSGQGGGPDGNALNDFFSWVRSSRVVRSRDRWVAGVCGGLAERLGWSPTLVRALMLGAVLLGGLGAAFYAFAWLLLPDRDTGEIYGEELVAGHFDWSMLGMLVLLVCTILLPGVGLAAIVVALAVGFVLLQWSRREIEKGRWSGMTGNGPFGPVGPTAPASPVPVGQWQPVGQGQPAHQAAQSVWPAPTPGSVPFPGPAPVSGPVPSVASGMPAASAQPMASMPGPAPAVPGAAAPAAASAMSGSVSVPSAMPVPPAPLDPRRSGKSTRPHVLRRKPAGFAMVMICLGLILISGAVVFMQASAGNVTLTEQLRMMLIWSSAVCLALGAIVFILGCMGRRSGGLIPVSLLAATLAIVIGMYGAVFNYSTTSYGRLTQGMTVQSVGDYDTIAVTSATMKQLVQGMSFEGHDDQQPWKMVGGDVYPGAIGDNSSDLNIDMTRYAQNNGTHTITLNSGGKRTSTCPVGTINVAARFTDVSIVLPDGCTYELQADVAAFRDRSSDGVNGQALVGSTMSYDDAMAVVNRSYGMVTAPWTFGVGVMPSFTQPHASRSCTWKDDSGSSDSDSTSDDMECTVKTDDHYDWLLGRSSDPEEPELVIHVSALMSARIGVEYQSTTSLPGYNN
ncbi:PspC domain-containing protein [Bifidobacterium vespertilionis]|nr:PspC domain-containing protein [Bifidobacterium vespertilionis]